MASILVRSIAKSVKVVSTAAPKAALRALSSKVPAEQGNIPDVEGLTGRARQEEVFRRAYGESIFDRDALAYFEEGTRENPIPILSVEDSRVVGISLPDDNEIRWFELKAGQLAYDPDTCNFFALKKVTQGEVDEWVAKAEKQVVGGK